MRTTRVFIALGFALSLPVVHADVAHEKSRFAIIDQAYDETRPKPASDTVTGKAPWLYGEAELECWRLHVLRERSQAAGLKIGYPGAFHEASPRATFRLALKPGQQLPESLVLRAVGEVVVSLDEQVIYRGAATESPHRIVFPMERPAKVKNLRVALTTKGEPPALLTEAGPFATGEAAWSWSADGVRFGAPHLFPQSVSGVPPHRVEPSEVILKPEAREGDVFDLGREVFGRIAFTCPTPPSLFVGESLAEAKNANPRHFEQSLAIKSLGAGKWISEHPLALRYFRITGGEPTDTECRALFSPAHYRGAFACSDERLTRIWMASAYTLRLCRHDFLIDGVKRDRLPWVGDLAMSLMANAYAFGDGEIVRRSLVALGREGISRTHLNGIVDYSMWWVVAQEYYQRYYADAPHLRREWPRIKDTLERLSARANEEGLYTTAPKDWVFIDWVPEDKQSALQILWWWAQSCGATLSERAGDKEAATQWKTRAAALEKTLLLRSWDEPAGTWRGRPDGTSGASRNANIFAVVSGLAKPAQSAGIRAALLGDKTKAVGTPYLAGFEAMALARLGATDSFLRRVDDCWGSMLDRSATTFWEAWNPNQRGDDAYGFYNRPYAKSLCHAWSAGPAAFLPGEIFGLQPLADGWTRFAVEPRLGPLEWACATVPTPQGDIEVVVETRRLTLRIPKGATALWRGRIFPGPGIFNLNL